LERDLSPRLDTSSRFAKSGKRKAGFTSVVAVIILLGLVVVMGSVALIWGNNLNLEKQKLGDYYTTNANKIKERIIIEDVWLSTHPGYTGVVVIRNVGDIGIKLSEVKINVLNSTGGAVCTQSCKTGTSASNAVKPLFSPDSTDGLINSQQSLMVAVDKIDWNHTNSKNIEVFITTDRGSIIWRVYDWKTQVAQVVTCNGLPATIVGKDYGDPLNILGIDNLWGTDEDDVIALRGGADTLNALGGDDVICGGNEGDFLDAGPGNDKIFGENGVDQLFGRDDNDYLYGGPDADYLYGNDGDDYLDGGPSTDQACDGGTGTNTIVDCP
jgi:Ca2+-binding RTX toxin-like protein